MTVVALRKESVDRNTMSLWMRSNRNGVALRKESVDRNIDVMAEKCQSRVALRKESVDRNLIKALWLMLTPGRSPQGERG